MFWSSKKKEVSFDDLNELLNNMEKLWDANASLASLVKSMTDLMAKMTEGMQGNRTDIDYLAQQTLRIAETQNKILSHLSGKQAEEYIARDFTGTIH